MRPGGLRRRRSADVIRDEWRDRRFAWSPEGAATLAALPELADRGCPPRRPGRAGQHGLGREIPADDPHALAADCEGARDRRARSVARADRAGSRRGDMCRIAWFGGRIIHPPPGGMYNTNLNRSLAGPDRWENVAMTRTATLTFDGRTIELPVIEGTEGEMALDISELRAAPD